MAARARNQKTRIEDIRRVELIDAAHRIFLRDGLKGLTTTRICHEAGMSQGILTYYFKDKEEVLFEMVRMNHRILMAEVVINLRAAKTRWERLVGIIDGNFPLQRFDRPTARAWISLYSEASQNVRYARLLRPYYRRLKSNVVSVISPLVPESEIDGFVDGLAAMIDGLWVRCGHSDTPDFPPERARRLVVAYAEKMLGSETVARLKAAQVAGQKFS